jgi:uncharacterized damage-inducible protein DinB
VANHGVHHRAQALHYLKQFGKSVPGGIDYLFYRLAATTLEQPPESVDALQQFGLAVGTLQTGDPVYDPALADRLFAYHDWANAELMAMCYSIGEAALDKDFAMGPGSIRKAWLHLMDAEAWWMGIWSEQSSAYPHSPEDTPLQSIREQLAELAARRREFLATLNRDSAAGVVTVSPGGPPVSFRISESVVQLALHGTHHRAQIINMIRRAGGKIRDIDLLDWPAVAKATPA